MPAVAAYHRPTTLADALDLLRDARCVVLAGGTVVNAGPRPEPVEVVDLQALALDAIDVEGERVGLGATARLQDVADHDGVPEGLRDLARREAPSALRTLATVGGTVATADPESAFLAGLLAHEAVVHLEAARGQRTVPLPQLLADRPALAGVIITRVDVAAGGATAVAATGRTPADTPIVAAVARRAGDGRTSLALTGVAPTPVLVDAADPAGGLAPTGDFRGSAEYRLHLARTLAARALEGLA